MSDDRPRDPSSWPLRRKIRVAFRNDPTKGVFLLLLLLLAVGFLLAGVLTFWQELVDLVV